MSKRKASKHKLDRRMGENIWGRPNSPVNRRSYGPGQHGQRRKSKVSDCDGARKAVRIANENYCDVDVDAAATSGRVREEIRLMPTTDER